jgi:ABC-type polysaccharide transport system permease subunit
MALPGIIMLFVFAYLPMFGILIAFKDYRFAEGILGSQWVGFQNFRFLFGTDVAWRITRNTLAMNSLFIMTSTVAALTIAILMNEIYHSRMRRLDGLRRSCTRRDCEAEGGRHRHHHRRSPAAAR